MALLGGLASVDQDCVESVVLSSAVVQEVGKVDILLVREFGQEFVESVLVVFISFQVEEKYLRELQEGQL